MKTENGKISMQVEQAEKQNVCISERGNKAGVRKIRERDYLTSHPYKTSAASNSPHKPQTPDKIPTNSYLRSDDRMRRPSVFHLPKERSLPRNSPTRLQPFQLGPIAASAPAKSRCGSNREYPLLLLVSNSKRFAGGFSYKLWR